MEERRVRRVKKEEKVSNLLWWGYRHVNGAYLVKRYLMTKTLMRLSPANSVMLLLDPSKLKTEMKL
jgi:hypothetical protein